MGEFFPLFIIQDIHVRCQSIMSQYLRFKYILCFCQMSLQDFMQPSSASSPSGFQARSLFEFISLWLCSVWWQSQLLFLPPPVYRLQGGSSVLCITINSCSVLLCPCDGVKPPFISHMALRLSFKLSLSWLTHYHSFSWLGHFWTSHQPSIYTNCFFLLKKLVVDCIKRALLSQ